MNTSISKKEILAALETEKTLVLATCADNNVTIRPMSHINIGLSIFFQTGSNSEKIRQIRKNPLVALCVGTYQIEGYSTVLGHPLVKENSFFAQKYKEKHPGSFERYSSYEDEIVVKVDMRRVKQWRYIDSEPFLAEINLVGEQEDHEN